MIDDSYALFSFQKSSKFSSCFQGERGIGKPRDGKRASNQRPTKTLFVINFDPILTKEGDIDMHFEPYGKVRIRHNFAFVQFATQEDAIKALESTPKLVTRVQLLMEVTTNTWLVTVNFLDHRLNFIGSLVF